MEEKLQELKALLAEVDDLQSAASVLRWDQLTYMPPGGAPARARQISRLRRIAHERLTEPRIGELLEELQSYEQGLPYDCDEAALIRVTRRDYEKAAAVPPSFKQELSSHTSASYQAWVKARPADDFAAVQPFLEKTLELSRRLADFYPGYEHIADPLIDLTDQGMTASAIGSLFAQLREQLVPIAKAIAERPPADDACLRQSFPEPQQLAFGLEVIRRFGYDLARGRLDKTAHPFATKFSLGDVRITARADERNLGEALFSMMHEAGHGIYSQSIPSELEGTPLAGGASAGLHESQSRLWENLVGRSRSFWQFMYPELQDAFPDQLRAVPQDTFYRAINRVTPSLIRTDADEVTYNLHVMIRFDLAMAMLEGRLAVRDLPGAWRERYEADLGVVPPDDRDGALQDVHWYNGVIGNSFHCYTLGNVLSAQLFEAALKARPEITSEMKRGEFGTLHTWLTEAVCRHGRKFTPQELIVRATGSPMSIEPYIRYLRGKYGGLYGL